jgi:hypothetical protein
MTAPSSDTAGIRQTIRALKDAGYEVLEVFDGEDTIRVKSEREAIEAITAVDDATLFVHKRGDDRNPWVRFVMGNDPEEVICDHVVSLSPVLDPLTDRWNEEN